MDRCANLAGGGHVAPERAARVRERRRHAFPTAGSGVRVYGPANLRRFGVLGAGLGSQIYIGQLYALGAGLTTGDLSAVIIAGAIAALAAIVPRVLSGPAE